MTISYADAILALGGENFSVGNDPSEVYYVDGNTKNITTEQIKTKYDELVEENKKIQYQRDRAAEYPVLPEQLDMLFHAIDAGALDKTSAFYTTLKAVKDKYPKG